MMQKRTGIVAIAMGCALLGGCGIDSNFRVNTGPDQHSSVHLDNAGIEKANIELNMGAGQMAVGGGAGKLIDGTFTYNVADWKPIVTNSTNGSHATVTIKQPSGGSSGGNTKNNWDLSLNDHVLTDLAINCGAAQAKLNLGTIALRSLNVQMGVGQVLLDLDGTPTHDYDVKIEGGVGQADVRLPKGVGIWVAAHGGIGEVSIKGLTKKGDHWENDLYDKAKVTVKVEVNGGIGEIKIAG